MKASLIAKILVILCFCSLLLGIFSIEKQRPYQENKNSKVSIKTNANKIAVIELDGAIAASSDGGFLSKEANASNMLKSLKLAKEDKDVQGVILKINSPGGTVGMSQSIYNQVLRIRKDKPVIAVLDDVAASGGYYIASAADRIVAQEGTLTGSVGVIFSFMDYHNLLTDKLNIKPVVIKSGKFKDIASGSRAMTSEEKELMQDIVNDSYQQFLNAIRVGRVQRNDNYAAVKTQLTEENLKKYADGRVFTGKMAKTIGYVDETGDIDTAKDMIEQMAKEKFKNELKAKLISYNKRSTLTDYFSGLTEYSFQGSLKLTDIVPTSMILSRKPLYLWE